MTLHLGDQQVFEEIKERWSHILKVSVFRLIGKFHFLLIYATDSFGPFARLFVWAQCKV
jgi:hypothetical protein